MFLLTKQKNGRLYWPASSRHKIDRDMTLREFQLRLENDQQKTIAYGANARKVNYCFFFRVYIQSVRRLTIIILIGDKLDPKKGNTGH